MFNDFYKNVKFHQTNIAFLAKILNQKSTPNKNFLPFYVIKNYAETTE